MSASMIKLFEVISLMNLSESRLDLSPRKPSFYLARAAKPYYILAVLLSSPEMKCYFGGLNIFTIYIKLCTHIKFE